MLKPYKAIYAFIYIGVINKAITFERYHELLGSINSAYNLEKIFDQEVYSDPYILRLTCSQYIKEGKCISCEKCLLYANLYSNTNIDDICLVNALLLHTRAKID